MLCRVADGAVVSLDAKGLRAVAAVRDRADAAERNARTFESSHYKAEATVLRQRAEAYRLAAEDVERILSEEER